MKAIYFTASDATNATPDSPTAELREVPTPLAQGRDVLVRVEAVSVNPVDTKMRPDPGEDAAILGYDASGVVEAVGDEVTTLHPGDLVYYAGDIRRPGSNAEYQLVDERIVARRPQSLSAAESAALPLTTLTAWEALFERLHFHPDGRDAGASVLIIGGAGGVGSMAIQLAKMAGLTVVATASRTETMEWCRCMGADFVINHRNALRPQLEQLGFTHVDAIANFHSTDDYWSIMGDLIAPLGRIVLIVEASGPLDMGGALKQKSVTIAWEFMFTRSMFTTADMQRQKEILETVAAHVDAGRLRTTLTQTLGAITVENLIEAHRLSESGRVCGKIVLANL